MLRGDDLTARAAHWRLLKYEADAALETPAPPVFMIGLWHGFVWAQPALGCYAPSTQAISVIVARITFGDFVPVAAERKEAVLAMLREDGFKVHE